MGNIFSRVGGGEVEMFSMLQDFGINNIVNILWKADMSYNTILFWGFLIIFMCVYLLLRAVRARQYWLLIGSLAFYWWNGIGAFAIVSGTALVVYVTSRKIEKIYCEFDRKTEGLTKKEQRNLFVLYKKKASKYLWMALSLIVGILIYVKCIKLIDVSIIEELSNISLGLAVIVPLGISYYTLSSIGYLLDVYWKKITPEHNFLLLFSAMIYFPHIVQGPISKYNKIVSQIKFLPNVEYSRVCYGLQLMLWGYMKKLIVADHIAVYTTCVFADPTVYSGIEVLAGVVLCVVQIYADFSGCMDIVRGISQVIGIELEQNFRQPFFAQSAQEFWTRWHITLGEWSKEYICFPFAVQPRFMKYIYKLKKEKKERKASFISSACPLLIAWIFTGLWHGTGVDYLMWGMYWCILMIFSKELKPFNDKVLERFSIQRDKKFYQIWGMIRTTVLFAIGRMITVTGETLGAWILIKQIFTNHKLFQLFLDGTLYEYMKIEYEFYYSLLVALAVTFFGVIVMFGVDILHERGIEIRKLIAEQRFLIRWSIYYLAFICVMFYGKYGSVFDASSFIYGGF